MIQYTLGFVFQKPFVLLLRKVRPVYHSGQLNGVGGKMEGNESPCTCMTRECREEVGLDIEHTKWNNFTRLKGYKTRHDRPTWTIHCFYHHYGSGDLFEDYDPDYNLNEGHAEIVRADQLPSDVLPNLHWLIPMALEANIFEYNAYSYQ